MAAVVVRELKHNRRIEAIALESVETGEELWRAERERDGSMLTAGTRAELDELAASGSGMVRIRVRTQPTQKLLVRVADIPGHGWRTLEARRRSTSTRSSPTSARCRTGCVRVEVADDGTWSVNGRGGLRPDRARRRRRRHVQLVPARRRRGDRHAGRVDVAVEESGPLRARLRHHVDVPLAVATRGPLVDVDVTTTLELHAGEQLLRVTTEWDNRCRDQRVRVWFPLPSAADRSRAECAFAVVERGLTAEGGPTEIGLPTFPSKRFVQAGGLTVVHDGVMEYELVDVRDGPRPRARAHARAVHRAAVARSDGHPAAARRADDPCRRRAAPEADRAPLRDPRRRRRPVRAGGRPARAAAGHGGRRRPARRETVRRSTSTVPSSRRCAGSPVGSSCGCSTRATTSRRSPIDGRSGWLVDLRGRALEPFTGSFELGPWRIATAVLD